MIKFTYSTKVGGVGEHIWN